MTILYFTGTGNSLQIAKSLGGELRSIPQLMREENFEIEDDVVGIVCPVYFVNIPILVVRYLSSVKLKANYIFGVLTYGKFSGAASHQLEKAVLKNGNRIDYIRDVLMIDNYLPRFEMTSEISALPQKRIDAQIQSLIGDISANKRSITKRNALLQLVTEKLSPLRSEKALTKLQSSDNAFSVDDKCNGCGTCAKVCPVDNISLDKKPQYLHHCERCYSCIHNCPQNAIHLDGEKSHVRFRNSNVSLKEIVQSNSSRY